MPDSASLILALVVFAGFTSFITASLGVGGGLLLLAVMAQLLPPELVIPVHGIVQLGSNFGRAVLSRTDIQWPVLRLFSAGAIVGALIGSLVVISLPFHFLYLTIASLMLYLSWGPKLPGIALGPSGTAAMGAATTFLTLFAGATGPLVGSYMRAILDNRFAIVGTLAAAMSVQHLLKAVVFQAAGVDLLPWAGLMAGMIASGALGTWIGLKVLLRVPEQLFQKILKALLTVLALRLLWQAAQALWGGP